MSADRGLSIADEVELAISSPLSSDAVRVWIWLRLYNVNGAGLGLLVAEFPGFFECLFELEHAGVVKVDCEDPAIIPVKWSPGTSADILERFERPAVSLRSKETITNNQVPNTQSPITNSSAHAPSMHGRTGARAHARIYTRAKTIESLTGLARLRAALLSPDSHTAKETIDIAMTRAFEAYNEVRAMKGVHVIHHSQRPRFAKYLLSIVTFQANNDVDLIQFFKLAFDTTRWSATNFPPLSVCAGPWVQDQWFSKGQKASKHAGHSYREPNEATRSHLISQGIPDAAGWDDPTIRYVEDQAKAYVESPHLTEIDPDYEDAVKILVVKMQKK